MSTRNAVLIAGNIYKALKEELPADSAYFHRRLLAFTAKARRLDSTIVTTLAQARPRTAASSPLTFLIYHPALTYFAREYGLRQLVLEEEGKEPTASSMAAVIRQARAPAYGHSSCSRRWPTATMRWLSRPCSYAPPSYSP